MLHINMWHMQKVSCLQKQFQILSFRWAPGTYQIKRIISNNGSLGNLKITWICRKYIRQRNLCVGRGGLSLLWPHLHAATTSVCTTISFHLFSAWKNQRCLGMEWLAIRKKHARFGTWHLWSIPPCDTLAYCFLLNNISRIRLYLPQIFISQNKTTLYWWSTVNHSNWYNCCSLTV